MTATARRCIIVLAGLALGIAAAATSLGPIRSFAASLTVTSATDLTAANPTCTNPCSLRQAIVDANATAGAVVITFAVPGPFDLTNGELTVNGSETSLDLQGATGGTVIHQDGTDRVLLIETSGISVTLSGVTLTGGHAVTASGTGDDGYGGAIDINTGATVTIINSTITGNSAQVGGGAIDDNTTSGLTLVGTTVSGNSAAAEGGGVDDNTVATLTAINSTFAGNTAGIGGGGAIAAITAAKITLVNDTVTANSSPSGAAFGAVQATGTGASTITNTIVSGNTGNNCAGLVTDGGNNLEQGSSCGFSTNAQHGDPLLDSLLSNGGPTPTMALKPGSAAIFGGSDSACAAASSGATPGAGGVDQRGAHRPQSTHCDIGAFEVIATTTTLAAPSSATAGSAISLTAKVTAAQLIPGPASGVVSFYDGTTLLGTATLAADASATLTTSGLAAGSQSVTARYSQTPLFLASVSAAATVNVATPVPTVGGTPPWAPAGALVLVGVALAGGVVRRARTSRNAGPGTGR